MASSQSVGLFGDDPSITSSHFEGSFQSIGRSKLVRERQRTSESGAYLSIFGMEKNHMNSLQARDGR